MPIELKIIEQPCSFFRFRYKSELHGAHGHIVGENWTSASMKLPKVELLNCPDKQAVIRCTLATAKGDRQHPHSLVGKLTKGYLTLEPHDLIINKASGWAAEFKFGIIQTARRDASKALSEKYERIKNEKIKTRCLNTDELDEIENRAIEESDDMDLTAVRLRFEALNVNFKPYLNPDGSPIVVFSQPIRNKKNTCNEELLISESSHYAGSCAGDEKVMLFVNKVDKKNIQVRFYQENAKGDLIWEDYGKFSENDVWHQYGISLYTPPYKDQDINSDVVVLMELVRRTDGGRSSSLPFTYQPLDEPPSKQFKRTMPENCQSCNSVLEIVDEIKCPMPSPQEVEGYIVDDDNSSDAKVVHLS